MVIGVRCAAVLLLVGLLASVTAADLAPFGRRLAQKDKCAGLTTAACDTGAKKGWGCCNTATACATCALRPKMKQTVATCSSGCSYACSPKWGDCNGDLNTPDASDGCETNLQNSFENCGACSSSCAGVVFLDASTTCGGGKCVLGTCNEGRANCDDDDSNGCEYDTAWFETDPDNCGACGFQCDQPNTICSGAACICAPGFLDCDLTAPGCETTDGGSGSCPAPVEPVLP